MLALQKSVIPRRLFWEARMAAVTLSWDTILINAYNVRKWSLDFKNIQEFFGDKVLPC